MTVVSYTGTQSDCESFRAFGEWVEKVKRKSPSTSA